MADRKPPGRPRKADSALTRDRILSAALPMVQQGGADAVSFRRLSDQLGVTPMAVKYHVGNKRQLLADLVKIAFADAVGPVSELSPSDSLRTILSQYCTCALKNANLLACILDDPTLMSEDLIRITDQIRDHTRALAQGDPQDAMLNLLVDYTHGFVFSAHAAPDDIAPGLKDFQRSLDWVLGMAEAAN